MTCYVTGCSLSRQSLFYRPGHILLVGEAELAPPIDNHTHHFHAQDFEAIILSIVYGL